MNTKEKEIYLPEDGATGGETSTALGVLAVGAVALLAVRGRLTPADSAPQDSPDTDLDEPPVHDSGSTPFLPFTDLFGIEPSNEFQESNLSGLIYMRELANERAQCIENALNVRGSELGCTLFDERSACPSENTFYNLALRVTSPRFCGYTLRDALLRGTDYYCETIGGHPRFTSEGWYTQAVAKAGKNGYADVDYEFSTVLRNITDVVSSFVGSTYTTWTIGNCTNKLLYSPINGKTLRQYWAESTWKRVGYQTLSHCFHENYLCDYGESHCVGINERLLNAVLAKGVELLEAEPSVIAARKALGRAHYESVNGRCIAYASPGDTVDRSCEATRAALIEDCNAVNTIDPSSWQQIFTPYNPDL